MTADTPTSPDTAPALSDAGSARQSAKVAQQAAALRANLARRKEQARGKSLPVPQE